MSRNTAGESVKPSMGAAAVLFDDKGRVLLVKENYGHHRWSLPGGAIEAGESAEEAAVRETNEETELVVAVDHLIGEYRLDDGFTAFAFRCVLLEGTASVPPTDEIAEVGWYPPDDLPTPRSNVLHYGIPDAVAGTLGVVRDVPRRDAWFDDEE